MEIRKCKNGGFEDLPRHFAPDVKGAPQIGIGSKYPLQGQVVVPIDSRKSGRRPDTSP